MVKKIIGYLKYIQSPVNYARWRGVKVGDNCFISSKNWSSEPYLITIGNNVQVTQDVWFHTHGGCHVARTEIRDFDVFGKIRVCDNVYIGSGSHIMPGVTIGEGSLIAAGSIVTKSVPAREVWGGNPARFICNVDDYIKRNANYNVGTYGLSFEDKKNTLLSTDESKFIKK